MSYGISYANNETPWDTERWFNLIGWDGVEGVLQALWGVEHRCNQGLISSLIDKLFYFL